MADSKFSTLKSMSRVSRAPTRVRPTGAETTKKSTPWLLEDLFETPFKKSESDSSGASAENEDLSEKLRQAYFWMVNHAIISPFYDIEFNREPAQEFRFGERKAILRLPTEQSYSSFVLLPLLTFAVRRKCLLIGGPGRGKTASAVLLSLIAGNDLKDTRRAIQKGQPQMTVSDLLGNPLPSDLVGAKSFSDIKIAWKKWLSLRVKIIDEYNRIPTRTQSALLTVMADNYAEIFDQVLECPESAWFLTANDDAGGGTYQVIEALRDRIDVVVRALHFNTRFFGELLERVETGVSPEKQVPAEIIFTQAQWDAMYAQILRVPFGRSLRRRLEFFCSQLEFFDSASKQMEYKTKDSLKLAGLEMREFSALESGKDPLKDLGQQTRNGLSVRALQTSIYFLKAMAYFRGSEEVGLEDMRQILPFVFHDKLSQNTENSFFESDGRQAYRADPVGWIREIFDLACAEYDRLALDKKDPLAEQLGQMAQGLDGVSADEVRRRMTQLEGLLRGWGESKKFPSYLYDDVLAAKALHNRYGNYLRWLEWSKS